jgi:GxxExxY protein
LWRLEYIAKSLKSERRERDEYQQASGCFERVYEEILCYELTKLGYKVLRQLLLAIDYEKLRIKDAYKVDLLIEDKLVVELKSIHPLPLVYFNQLQT